jgi:S-adenosylmethionine synthetase
VRPVDPSAEQNVATRNRVTIAVEVRYYDQVEDQEMLSRTFENFGEYNPNETGLDGERTAAQEALEKIADDIFSAATSDW